MIRENKKIEDPSLISTLRRWYLYNFLRKKMTIGIYLKKNV